MAWPSLASVTRGGLWRIPHVHLVASGGVERPRHRRFLPAFADDAVLHGADQSVQGREAIGKVIRQQIELSNDTLFIDVHDVLANDEHTVILQTTTAQLGDKHLSDRVIYMFHVDDGLIGDAYFTGPQSPRGVLRAHLEREHIAAWARAQDPSFEPFSRSNIWTMTTVPPPSLPLE